MQLYLNFFKNLKHLESSGDCSRIRIGFLPDIVFSKPTNASNSAPSISNLTIFGKKLFLKQK